MSQKRQSNILKRAPKLELETPIRAQAVAVGVCDELSGWLGEALPRGWVRQLIAEAGTAYACNERFRRRVRGKNANGRDYLWIFMRHWLAAKVLERRPHLHARLPAAYNYWPRIATQTTDPASPRERPSAAKVRPRQRIARAAPVCHVVLAAASDSH